MTVFENTWFWILLIGAKLVLTLCTMIRLLKKN